MATLDALPQDLLVQILSYTQPSDVLELAPACRALAAAAADKIFWKHKLDDAVLLLTPSVAPSMQDGAVVLADGVELQGAAWGEHASLLPRAAPLHGAPGSAPGTVLNMACT